MKVLIGLILLCLLMLVSIGYLQVYLYSFFLSFFLPFFLSYDLLRI